MYCSLLGGVHLAWVKSVWCPHPSTCSHRPQLLSLGLCRAGVSGGHCAPCPWGCEDSGGRMEPPSPVPRWTGTTQRPTHNQEPPGEGACPDLHRVPRQPQARACRKEVLSGAVAALVGGDMQRLKDGGQLDSQQRWGQHLAVHGGQCQVAPGRSKGGHLAGGGKKGVGNRALCGRVIGAGAVHTPSLVLNLEQLGREEGPEVAGQECVCDISGRAGG